MRRYRKARAATKLLLVLGTLGFALLLSGCGNQNGRILEVETGRNGVKAEVQDGTGDYEVYLVRDTVCAPDDYIQDCADRDDYLIEPANHRAGKNR